MTATTERPAAPTFATVLAAHQRVVRLTARMIGPGTRGDMTAYFTAATERADAEREFQEMLGKYGRG